MLISMTLMRTPSQQAVATLRTWTVGEGTRDIAQVSWDPAGPLSSREAAMQALGRLLAALEELENVYA